MTVAKQQSITLEELSQIIRQHMEERDWHNNPSRGIAISLSLEANELLEHFQWGDKPVGDAEALGDELADIFIYGIQFAQQNNIDITKHIQRKLEKSAKKYPAANFKGKSEADRVDTWFKNKLAHKKSGL